MSKMICKCTEEKIEYGNTSSVTLKAGAGYWDITQYPVGGYFKRAGDNGLKVFIIERKNMGKGTDTVGKTENGLTIAFNSQYLEEQKESKDVFSGNENLEIKYLGEKEIIDIEGKPAFLHNGEEFLLDDFMKIDNDGQFKSFDGVYSMSAFDGYLIKLVDVGGGYFEKVKLYHFHSKG